MSGNTDTWMQEPDVVLRSKHFSRLAPPLPLCVFILCVALQGSTLPLVEMSTARTRRIRTVMKNVSEKLVFRQEGFVLFFFFFFANKKLVFTTPSLPLHPGLAT
jgi:hypothetical protein